MKLLPIRSFVRPWHRQSLKTLEDDLTWAGERKVDLESGAMLIKDNSEYEKNFDWKKVQGGEEFQAEWNILQNFNEKYIPYFKSLKIRY